jgi:nucleoid DNA-binding protein
MSKAKTAATTKSKSNTKGGTIAAIATSTGVAKKDVKSVLEALEREASSNLIANGSFTIAGIVKLKTKIKPATPERDGVDPFTKLQKHYAAKPASTKLKAFPAAAIKKAVAGK